MPVSGKLPGFLPAAGISLQLGQIPGNTAVLFPVACPIHLKLQRMHIELQRSFGIPLPQRRFVLRLTRRGNQN